MNKSLARFNKQPHQGFFKGMAAISLHDFFYLNIISSARRYRHLFNMQLSAKKNTLALVLQCVQYQEEMCYPSYCNSLCTYFWYTISHVAFFRHYILM